MIACYLLLVCSEVLPAGPLMSTTPAFKLCHLPPPSPSAVAAVFTVHWASWLDSIRITLLLLCKDHYFSVAGSWYLEVLPFGGSVFVAVPVSNSNCFSASFCPKLRFVDWKVQSPRVEAFL